TAAAGGAAVPAAAGAVVRPGSTAWPGRLLSAVCGCGHGLGATGGHLSGVCQPDPAGAGSPRAENRLCGWRGRLCIRTGRLQLARPAGRADRRLRAHAGRRPRGAGAPDAGKPRLSDCRGARTTSAPRGANMPQPARHPTSPPNIAGIVLSHPERVLYPEQGTTKRQLAEYFEEVADPILPHITSRPLSLLRCPRGREAACFFQRRLDHESVPGLERVAIAEPDGGSSDVVVVRDLAG